MRLLMGLHSISSGESIGLHGIALDSTGIAWNSMGLYGIVWDGKLGNTAGDAYTGAWWIGGRGIRVQGDIWDTAGHCWPPFGTSSGLLPTPIPFTSPGMGKENPPGEIAEPVWLSVNSKPIRASNLCLKSLNLQNACIGHKKALGISLAKSSQENPQIWEFHGKHH